MSVLDRAVVLDFETTPDLSVLGADYDKKKFPLPMGHQVVSVALCDISKYPDGFVVNKICSARGSELNALELTAEYLEKAQPQIVSWNGRGFDMQVLIQRCFKFGIPLPGVFKPKERNKWENYTQRYADNWHCDLMDAMTNFGACKNSKLDLVASSIGLPGKIGINGSDVADLYSAGEIDKIADYCELDVMNTYGVYLRWMLTTAKMSLDIYRKSVENFFGYIMKHSEDLEHFRDFIHHTDFNQFSLLDKDKLTSLNVSKERRFLLDKQCVSQEAI